MSLLKKMIAFFGRIWSGNSSPSKKTRRSSVSKALNRRLSLSSSSLRNKTNPRKKRISLSSSRSSPRRNHRPPNKPPAKRTTKLARRKIDPKVQVDAIDKKTGVCVGEITHFFSRIQVCVVKVSHQGLRVGDVVLISGKDTRFQQKIASLQVESVNVSVARVGQLVGLKLTKPAKVGDRVFKV